MEVLGTGHPKMRFAAGQASIDVVRASLYAILNDLPRSPHPTSAHHVLRLCL